MMLNFFDLQATADMMQTLVCVGIAIHTLEIIAERKQYGVHGIYRYTVLAKPRFWSTQQWWTQLLYTICESPCYLYLVALELAAALLLLFHLFLQLSACFLGFVLFVHLLSCLRNQYGLDGADQMQSILLICLLLFSLSTDPLVKLCCLLFICFQALLSYMTSGWVKVESSIWREGAAITNVLQITRFRNEALAQFLMKRPKLSKGLCWSVLLFESTFPLLTLTGVRTCLIFLSAGILFHLTIALVMGLSSFFWSFVATYPAILLFANTFQLVLFSHEKWLLLR